MLWTTLLILYKPQKGSDIMKTFSYTITEPYGIHARTATKLAVISQKYNSNINIIYKNDIADMKSILSVMSLCARISDTIIIEVNGIDEEQAINEIQQVITTVL